MKRLAIIGYVSATVVLLRAVNVGKANRCRPADIAKKLAKFDVVNIGAVGTFVVRKPAAESVLRKAIAAELPFKCHIMICAGRDILKLVASDPFAGQPSGPAITHFVSVLARPLATDIKSFASLSFPCEADWLTKVIEIRGLFVLGLYRREMKAITYLGKIEKLLGVPMTTRSWTTIERVAKVVSES